MTEGVAEVGGLSGSEAVAEANRRTEVDINRDAPVLGVAEIDVAAPLELVWKVQADLTSWPRWNPDVKSVELTGSLAPGTVFKWNAGGMKIVSQLRAQRTGFEGGIRAPGRTVTWHAIRPATRTQLRCQWACDVTSRPVQCVVTPLLSVVLTPVCGANWQCMSDMEFPREPRAFGCVPDRVMRCGY